MNFILYIFYASGAMRGVLTKPNGVLISRGTRTRDEPGDNGVNCGLKDRLIGSPDSFDFVIFPVFFATVLGQGNIAWTRSRTGSPAPARHTAPEDRASDAPGSRRASRCRSRSRRGRSGFGTASGAGVIQVGGTGGRKWSTVDEGTNESVTRKIAPGGGSLEIRVVAEESVGKPTNSVTRRFVMPWWMTRTGVDRYGGPWTAVEHGVNGMFGKTSTRGAGGDGHIQCPQGTRLCILGGPTDGAEATATVTIDGREEGTLSEDGRTAVGDKVSAGVLPEPRRDLPRSHGPGDRNR